MFSKLQLCILGGCILVVSVAYGIFAFKTSGPARQVATSNSSIYSGSDATEPEPTAPRAISHPTKPITEQHSPSIITNGNEADEKIIDAVMQKFASTFKTGEGTLVVDVMYTPVLESLGGRKKASEDLKAVMEMMKEVLVSWKVNKPYLYVAGKSHKYVVIPYEAKVKSSEGILTQTSYELGIKTAESGWQFVGGDVLSEELYDKFFPDFPKDVELPEVEQH